MFRRTLISRSWRGPPPHQNAPYPLPTRVAIDRILILDTRRAILRVSPAGVPIGDHVTIVRILECSVVRVSARAQNLLCVHTVQRNVFAITLLGALARIVMRWCGTFPFSLSFSSVSGSFPWFRHLG